MARTPVYVPLLGRLSRSAPVRSALVLLCVGGLVGGCAAGPRPAAAPTGRSDAAPRPTPRAGAPAEASTGAAAPAPTAPPVRPLPTEAPPVTTLAVTAGGAAAGGAATATPPAAGAPRTHRSVPRTRPRAPAPHARRHRHGPATVCDLGEQYGKWAADGTDDAVCRSVYG